MDASAPTTGTGGRRNALAVIAGSILAMLGLAKTASAAKAASAVILGAANKATATTSITTTAGVGLAGTGVTYGVSGTAVGTATTATGVLGTAKDTTGYGVMSNGRLGVKGPVELAVVTVTSYAGPAAGKAYLYAKTNLKVTELHVKFPSGKDVVITSG